MERRSFLKVSGAGLGGLALAGPFSAAMARVAGAEPLTSAGYGPLSPVNALNDGVGYLSLPAGSSYYAFGHVGSTMTDGNVTPVMHDGMAAFMQSNGKIRLVRNHENRDAVNTNTGAIVPAALAHDPGGHGGCVILEFDPANPPASPTAVPSWVALGGTTVNCAGGPTPWGSWMTCEETTSVNSANGIKHGYIFEVPAATNAGSPVAAVPYVAMGRFAHEAVAIDPLTEWAYMTEDNGNNSGFYRFRPTAARNYTAGTLEMAKIGAAEYNTKTGQTVGAPLAVTWVPVADPDATTVSCFEQGRLQGGARFSRGEGIWYNAVDKKMYFNCTDGGAASCGQVFAFDPATDTATLVYESPNAATLLKPDNITISPEGNVWLIEDPDRAQRSRIKGLADDGTLFPFAENNRSTTSPGGADYLDEFAGGCFSPDGKWLFVNIQTPGVTLAITGPFGDGTGPTPVVPEFPTGAGAAIGIGAAVAVGGAAIALRNRGGADETPTPA
ncbi:DUF839 domain-containing protein [soil metagenome]